MGRCETCGDPLPKKNRRFCSKGCLAASYPKKTCPVCGKHHTNTRYYSKECYDFALSTASLNKKYTLNQQAKSLALEIFLNFKIRRKKGAIKKTSQLLRNELNLSLDEAKGYITYAKRTLSCF